MPVPVFARSSGLSSRQHPGHVTPVNMALQVFALVLRTSFFPPPSPLPFPPHFRFGDILSNRFVKLFLSRTFAATRLCHPRNRNLLGKRRPIARDYRLIDRFVLLLNARSSAPVQLTPAFRVFLYPRPITSLSVFLRNAESGDFRKWSDVERSSWCPFFRPGATYPV